MASLTAAQIVDRATTLKKYWNIRESKFKSWYEQIQMTDLLAQKDMESFVSNDPRASFNLIMSILNQRIPHRIKPELLTTEQIVPAALLSQMYDTIWENVQDSYRQRGRKFLRDLIGFLLATGWYSVFATISLDGSSCHAEIWNPATVFPMWDNSLVECSHIFTPGATQIQRMAERNGWKLSSTPSNRTTIYDYWWLEGANDEVHNSIVVGNDLVKPDTAEVKFTRIPIFTAPVGGLPDTGELSRKSSDNWKGEVGQSFIATNENVYKSFNKWWTFLLQLLRDTAQARTFEKSSSAKQLVKPEEWNRRGAHFKIGLQDDIGFINPPAIPVELRGAQLDLEAMMQRGGPSWTMFGNVQAQMSAYAMAQVVATTNQISKDFHQGIIDCFTDIDNFWLDMIRNNSYKPYNMSLPSGLPETAKLTAEYELRIPGDMVQRATTARILNPAFELSDERIMEELFPEIKNPAEELARVRSSKARKNEIYSMISLVSALKEEAELMRQAGDSEGAALYEKAAGRLEQQLTAEQETPQQQPVVEEAPVRPEVAPPTSPRVPAQTREL